MQRPFSKTYEVDSHVSLLEQLPSGHGSPQHPSGAGTSQMPILVALFGVLGCHDAISLDDGRVFGAQRLNLSEHVLGNSCRESIDNGCKSVSMLYVCLYAVPFVLKQTALE